MQPQPLEFSIVIPTFDRPAQLANLLTALTRLDYPRACTQVVVVDDGGTTPIAPVVDPFRGALDLTLFRQPNSGPASARNLGAAHARGQFLAFTDDDCLPDPRWLGAFSQRLSVEPCVVVGGQTINALPDNPYASASQMILDIVYAHYNSDPRSARFFAANNFAIPADQFRALGGFEPSFRTAEDRDLCDRWLASGNRMRYEPGAVIFHSNHLTLRSFWRQHLHYGRGAYRFNRAHARRSALHSTLETSFYTSLFGLVRARIVRLPLRRAVSLAVLMALWQVANTVGFVSQAIESGFR